MANNYTLPVLTALALAMAPDEAEAQTVTSTVPTPEIYKPSFEIIPGYSFKQSSFAAEGENPSSRTRIHSPKAELNMFLGENKDHKLTLRGNFEIADRKTVEGTKNFNSVSGSITYQPPQVSILNVALYLGASQRDPLILAAQGRGEITMNPGLELKFALGDEIYLAFGGQGVIAPETIDFSRVRISSAVEKELIKNRLSAYIGGAFEVDVYKREVGTMNLGFAWYTPEGIELLLNGEFIQENRGSAKLAFPIYKGLRGHIGGFIGKKGRQGKDEELGFQAGFGLAKF